jgi:hypothetical protein
MEVRWWLTPRIGDTRTPLNSLSVADEFLSPATMPTPISRSCTFGACRLAEFLVEVLEHRSDLVGRDVILGCL